jgi:hypothetical protein
MSLFLGHTRAFIRKGLSYFRLVFDQCGTKNVPPNGRILEIDVNS